MLTLGAGSMARAQQPDPVQVLSNWFQHFLGRPVDQESLNAWVPVLNRVGPLETLAGLLASDGYWIHNGSTPQGLVLGLYRDVLGQSQFQVRPQDVDSWVNRMAQSSRQAVTREFLNNAKVNPYAFGAGVAAPPAPPVYAPPTYTPPTPTYRVPYWGPYSYPPPRGRAWGW